MPLHAVSLSPAQSMYGGGLFPCDPSIQPIKSKPFSDITSFAKQRGEGESGSGEATRGCGGEKVSFPMCVWCYRE